MEDNILKKAILVAVAKSTSELEECEKSLDELERLLDTAGGESYARVIQVKPTFDPRTVIGSGKVLEIKELCEANDIELVVFDFELSPMQIRNLEEDIGNVDVIDRNMLILDIFALHASTGEGKLQVELAQLKYTAPRLVGKGAALSRQGGGIGTRGPGETQLESDRRHLHSKIAALEAKLRQLEHNRGIMRAQRDRSGLFKIAVVGYTNAGKSTLLNRLTGADVLAEDKLFATLDPTTRKLELPCGETVLLTDTVGFIRKLPHHLIDAFRSTLEEAKYADMILHVVDASNPDADGQMHIVYETLRNLGVKDKPVITAFNKQDMVSVGESIKDLKADRVVRISAKHGQGLPELLEVITELLRESKVYVECVISYAEGNKVALIRKYGELLSEEYVAEGTAVKAYVPKDLYGQLFGTSKE